MRSSQFQHRWGNQQLAHVYTWQADGAARGCVQIIHGMAEHAGRYARLGEHLATAGYAVYAQDLPGHGRSALTPDALGYVSDRSGWQLTLASINSVRGHIESVHPGTPLFVLGHSRGSFLLQDYLVEHGNGLAGAIFSAGCADLGPMRAPGLALMQMEALWAGRAHRSALAEALTFKSFNRRFAPVRTAFDWLSRDVAEVDKYVADPFCGFRCATAMWIELLSAAGRLRDPQRLARVPKDLPILALNGSDDPAAGGEAGARSLERNYRNVGLSDVTLRLYIHGRHELLNDTCREEVTDDLRQWLDAHS